MTKKNKLPVTTLEPAEVGNSFAENAGAGLLKLAASIFKTQPSGFALIHADDGVLWGHIDAGRLSILSRSDWTPDLRTTTIQQCRVFNLAGELFIWREAEGIWRGRLFVEDGIERPTISESAILYGNQEVKLPINLPPGFTAIREEGLGVRQIVPVAITQADFDGKPPQRVKLGIIHYLAEDEDGQARIACSRLKKVASKPIKE
jgi:CRISPR-associated protein (TIGR03984 family)